MNRVRVVLVIFFLMYTHAAQAKSFLKRIKKIKRVVDSGLAALQSPIKRIFVQKDQQDVNEKKLQLLIDRRNNLVVANSVKALSEIKNPKKMFRRIADNLIKKIVLHQDEQSQSTDDASILGILREEVVELQVIIDGLCVLRNSATDALQKRIDEELLQTLNMKKDFDKTIMLLENDRQV